MAETLDEAVGAFPTELLDALVHEAERLDCSVSTLMILLRPHVTQHAQGSKKRRKTDARIRTYHAIGRVVRPDGRVVVAPNVNELEGLPGVSDMMAGMIHWAVPGVTMTAECCKHQINAARVNLSNEGVARFTWYRERYSDKSLMGEIWVHLDKGIAENHLHGKDGLQDLAVGKTGQPGWSEKIDLTPRNNPKR